MHKRSKIISTKRVLLQKIDSFFEKNIEKPPAKLVKQIPSHAPERSGRKPRKRKNDELLQYFKRTTRTSLRRNTKIDINEIIHLDDSSPESNILIPDINACNNEIQIFNLSPNTSLLDPNITDDDIILDEPTFSASQEEIDCQLWTCKYQPVTTNEVIGCSQIASELKSLISNWHLNRVNYYEDPSINFSENYCILLHGPPGIGKTSLVYAIAKELDFMVFEVNCCSNNDVGYITKKLKEATQSHHVGRSRSPRSFKESLKENKYSDSKQTLFSYFNSKPECYSGLEPEMFRTADVKCMNKNGTMNENSRALSLSSNSLVLFDDVDFMIGKDVDNFWKSLNTFIETSKKPVILTTTQFVEQVKKQLVHVYFYELLPPNVFDISKFLTNISKKECLDISIKPKYVAEFGGDIRKCLNELQFNCHSFGKETKDDKQMFSDFLDLEHYHSLMIMDLLTSKNGLLSPLDLKERFMKGLTLPFTDDDSNRQFSSEIIFFLNRSFSSDSDLESFYKRNISPFYKEKINVLYNVLSPNIKISEIICDYFPYLAEISRHEKEKIAQYSKRTRRTRYCSYLKVISLCEDYVDFSEVLKKLERN